MFIRVDLPAPFSPSRACTSPRSRSNETRSFATMPGNSFVIPRISRTSSPGIQGDPNQEPRWGWVAPPPSRERLRKSRRELQRPGDDLRLVLIHQGDIRLRHGRVDLADAHAPVLQVEDEVVATVPLAVLDLLDRVEDAGVDSLDGARQDALAQCVLVDVDADAPLAGFV